MEETQNHHLFRPLHPPTTADSAGTTPESRNDFNNFNFRLLFLACVALVSVWATHEASKGFAITIINDAVAGGCDTVAGKRFHLFYVSNDQATRLILERSQFAENTLYSPSDHHPKKTITHVILRLSSRNLSRPATTHSGDRDGEFVIHLSPSIMHDPNFKHAMFLAVQRGMARIWLWDGQGNAPITLINGIVDYISTLAVSGGSPPAPSGAELPEYSGSGCWTGNSDPRAVAGFLNYCEGKREGFLRRLNQEMKNNWHEKMVDDALGGMPAKTLCDSYHSSTQFSTNSI
nr:uncharacterized protein LOC109150370 [Ipomoea batatas]